MTHCIARCGYPPLQPRLPNPHEQSISCCSDRFRRVPVCEVRIEIQTCTCVILKMFSPLELEDLSLIQLKKKTYDFGQTGLGRAPSLKTFYYISQLERAL